MMSYKTKFLLFAITLFGLAACGGGGGGENGMRITPTDQDLTEPDLILDGASVDVSTPATGQSIMFFVTVMNRGGEDSLSTTLRYYRSDDENITADDTQVGTESIGVLAEDATSRVSISLTAPDTPGTYYYGACVESVSGETNTSNNCSDGISITISGAPDLLIGSLQIDDRSLSTGDTFNINLTIRNQGTGGSVSTTLRYYISSDMDIPAGDDEIATDNIPGIGAGVSIQRNLPLTAPAAGTYYYGACIESVRGETDTSNNCFADRAITVR